MRSILLTLAWKELREQKWAVAAAATIALFFPLALALMAYGDGQVWEAILATLICYPLFGGVFFGMRAAAGERAHRTAGFVAALPIAPPLAGFIKLAVTMIAAVSPIVALVLLGSAVLFRVNSEPVAWIGASPWMCLLGAASAAVTLHLLLFVAVFGAGQAGEMAAGIRGVLAVLIWAAAAMCAAHYFPENRPL